MQKGLGIAILSRLAAEPVPPDVQICPLPFPIAPHIGATILKDALHNPALYAFLGEFQDRKYQLQSSDYSRLMVGTAHH